MKHELEHQDLYTFGLDAKAINIEDLHNELDKYLVAIFPMNTNTIGRNPYVAAALERGLPIVLTVNSAEGMCEDCRDMVTRNPMDPFDSSPKHFPFLVSNVNEGTLLSLIFMVSNQCTFLLLSSSLCFVLN